MLVSVRNPTAPRPGRIRDFHHRLLGAGALPSRRDVEKVPKRDVLMGLANAARDCRTRRGYRKGRDSFEILARLDPDKVTAASPHAKRLVEALRGQVVSGPPRITAAPVLPSPPVATAVPDRTPCVPRRHAGHHRLRQSCDGRGPFHRGEKAQANLLVQRADGLQSIVSFMKYMLSCTENFISTASTLCS